MFQGDVKPLLKKEETDEADDFEPSPLPVAPLDFGHAGVFLFSDLVDWLKSDFEEEHVPEAKPKSVAAAAMAAIRREKQLQAAFAAADAASVRFNDPTRKETKDVVEAIEQLSVRTDSYDDLNDLIEQI